MHFFTSLATLAVAVASVSAITVPGPVPLHSPPDLQHPRLLGSATFFFQEGFPGACGTVHQDTDFIAAIVAELYGDNGERSALCGQQVAITNTNNLNGKSVTVTIADACPTCSSNSVAWSFV